ncbi:class III extradiol ring-cleavage dioxygenase [uncultured Aquimarina sp.]|uniref:DODA-type extradiol aromatic ring-opening family dioxygenase n=1 Tax=uncultured Aquimarina sp. TaxID=575652 RepID=UPI00260A4C51|nr:class III extradiol ring-cleavage dioxygenase [uncultured Aquimarina sp.]
MKTRQPSLFISHGTIYEAFKSEQLKRDFEKLRKKYLTVLPDAIVILSGHWQTKNIRVTANSTMVQLDEGFPQEFQSNYKTIGNPDLSNRIISLLNTSGIEASIEPKRGLDHGALIPLMLLFPKDNIPVIQISQNSSLDPIYHKEMGEVLRELRNEHILFIGSGGLVHNTNRIEKFGGHHLIPDHWAKTFDNLVTKELLEKTFSGHSQKMIDVYKNELFDISHPTTEHFLPLVFASALGDKPTKIYEGFQWKNISMSAFMFE